MGKVDGVILSEGVDEIRGGNPTERGSTCMDIDLT